MTQTVFLVLLVLVAVIYCIFGLIEKCSDCGARKFLLFKKDENGKECYKECGYKMNPIYIFHS
jgi:hypothetical protein